LSLFLALEGDEPEIYQQLCMQERQLRREGSKPEKAATLPGSKVPLLATITGLMGETWQEDHKQKDKMEELKKDLKSQGMSENEIIATIQQEYQKILQGQILPPDTCCYQI